MIIRECPKCNQPLTSQMRVIHHDNPNRAYNRRHPENPMIGGVYAPSNIEFLVCSVCGWQCEANKYGESISEYWMWQPIIKQVKEKGGES